MKYNNLKGSTILVIAAFIWGLAFVAQNEAAEYVAPFTFNALRSVVGAAVLYIYWNIIHIKDRKPFFPKEKAHRKKHLIADIICGLCLSISVNFQQFGIAAYPKGVAVEARSGFITALYVIIVPLVSLIFRKKISLLVWPGVIIAIAGIYLLCFSEGISGIYLGDLLVFFCALTFSIHIMAIDSFVGTTGGVKLSIMQFSVCAVISGILAVIFERDQFSMQGVITALPQILYLGIMSSGVAYTLQIVGQKYAEPGVASISMSLESVFGALGGWVISGNSLTSREIVGCVLVFAAIVVAQLPVKTKKSVKTAT